MTNEASLLFLGGDGAVSLSMGLPYAYHNLSHIIICGNLGPSSGV